MRSFFYGSSGLLWWRCRSVVPWRPDPGILESRRLDTGTLRWSWASGETWHESLDDIIATDNMAFVRTPSKVVAISTNSHAVEWGYYQPGRISLSSNGILYINRSPLSGAGSDGRLVAINLH